jgi:phospholipid/cholesterol/gamma-HCH transport system substrate-binding protein
MASIKTKFTVGLFVIVGLFIAVAAILWLGTSHYFEKGKHYAAYFDESVQGLDKDSSVKYRGVAIGRVDRIDVAPDGTLIEVVMKIESELKPAEDLVAQLKSVGITGIMFIELDQKSRHEQVFAPKMSFEPEYPVVATKPSDIKKLFEGLDDILKKMKALDTEGISKKIKETLDGVNHAVKEAQIGELSADIQSFLQNGNRLLDSVKWNRIADSVEKTGSAITALAREAEKAAASLNGTVVRFDRMLAESAPDIREGLSDFKKTVQEAEATFRKGTEWIGNTDRMFSGLHREFLMTLREIQKTGENLDRFLETVSDRPSSLIFSDPPEPRPIEAGP